jgi:lysozyme
MIEAKNSPLFKEFVESLKEDEGFVATPYRDSTDHLTIGYGTNLQEGISKRQAEALLNVHIEDLIDELAQLPHIEKLNDARYFVILNMAYNMGVPRLRKFRKMWEAIAEQDWENASFEMLDSLWAQQVSRRANYLAEIMKEGEWL